MMISIVEFATQEDAARAKEELSDKAFMGRAVFIREVSSGVVALPIGESVPADSYRTAKRLPALVPRLPVVLDSQVPVEVAVVSVLLLRA